MNRRTPAALAALLALAAPAALAQPAAPSLTPPAVLGAAKTIQFTATLIKDGRPEQVSVAYLAQPNKAFVQDTDAKTKAVDTVYASDGKTQTEYRASHKHYTSSAAPAQIAGMETHALAVSVLTDFLDSSAFAKFKDTGFRGVWADGREQWYLMPLGQQEGQQVQEYLVVDARTGLPKSVSIGKAVNEQVESMRMPGYQEAERIEFSHWKLNAPIPDRRFAYTPPATASLYTAPKLLADGAPAPDFTANDKDGKPVKLSDFKGRTVVLDFWATWCGPCQMSMPHTTQVAKRYADKGVTVLAVNVWDTPEAFRAWLPQHPQYAALRFAIDPATSQDRGIATGLYGVSGIPTQYVIGKDGRVVKSIVGYDEGSTALEDALKAAL
jgi:thiol-disulfide isomerase/thioredoxin